ncbi:flagellar hook-basal body complex protein FliE [Saccharophagus degradans]|uniref:Flagellar hook-basal body complex protein FliE n=1 Tax=Saccharophagus degradans (strain 2-40 / ATCC 43961 / DSM 17024) TaxID=203122 RepID=FLIE_SACD2|nr:flagellar hook-basal body complex protein FliE [Saccharophagus degradans]Q21IN0.1 RecName: Full=Flagellar hook-basal body complex protein FliE [Saccharophagus degradans 2-40]ABD81449.1 flagellar hook-basal body complex protein (FliE) [Saccharophagus degradans 2-40]
MTDRVDINRVLMEIRSFKAQNQAMNSVQGVGNSLEGVNNTRGTQQVNGPRFGELLEQAVSKVNEVQQASGAMSQAYIQGDSNVGITDVMIASQKAGVAFDAMVQVRNKLVEAYKDVMNMPI